MSLICGGFASHFSPNEGPDDVKRAKESEISYNDTLKAVQIVASLRHYRDLKKEPVSYSSFSSETIKEEKLDGLHEISYHVPNLFIPDYGSKMTSSIYARGMGGRMDNPVVGLIVDDIPYLEKNSYDAFMWDVSSIDVLRGPQSTLYGRNTMGGVISVKTISPATFQGSLFSITYGNKNSYDIKASTYHKINEKLAVGGGGFFKSSDGFFRNSYNGSRADDIKSAGGRVRIVYVVSPRLTINNSFFAGRVVQDGFAYAQIDTSTGKVLPINYNDPCSYRRTSFSDGLTMDYKRNGFLFRSMTSWQYLNDCMHMDQDFTKSSVFTLKQHQHENILTQDFVVRRNANPGYYLGGLSLFYKSLKTDAPVTFKQDGINNLILSNINRGIQKVFPDAEFLIRQNKFCLNSNFREPAFGAAAYGQTVFHAGGFSFTAAARFGYEHSSLKYLSNGGFDYRLNITMTDYKAFESTLQGKIKRDYLFFLPKLAIQHDIGKNSNVYFLFTRGYKTGGYNVQMFSDILKNKMQKDLMDDMGVHLNNGNSYSSADIMSYKPEFSWNYELGGHFSFAEGRVKAHVSAFYISCHDLQLTVFPGGKITGRMMTNAGRTRNEGVELSGYWKIFNNLETRFSYGYTNAKFTSYDNGITDYKGKQVPYIPENTVSVSAAYTFHTPALFDYITVNAGYEGFGKIYWNEANTVSQKFYSLPNASLYMKKGRTGIRLFAKNISGTKYNTFYFESMENVFLAKGKPCEYGITIDFTL
jgi:outer membrane receptor protein involved in Fe transport